MAGGVLTLKNSLFYFIFIFCLQVGFIFGNLFFHSHLYYTWLHKSDNNTLCFSLHPCVALCLNWSTCHVFFWMIGVDHLIKLLARTISPFSNASPGCCSVSLLCHSPYVSTSMLSLHFQNHWSALPFHGTGVHALLFRPLSLPYSSTFTLKNSA